MDDVEMDYVRNKQARIMPSKAKIIGHWADKVGATNTHEAKCFKCGYDEDLERAHIVPRCFGGSDDVSNIHLLCSLCHRIAEYWLGADSLSYNEYAMNYNNWIGFEAVQMEETP